MQSSVFNRDACVFFVLALMLNFVFFFFNYKTKYFSGLLHPHGEVAYNLYKYNSVKINKARLEELGRQEFLQEKRIDYADIDHEKLGEPTSFRNVLDSIGYGVVLGLIWKITGSLRYRDIEFVQIFIFSFLMFLFYQIAMFLFFDRRVAIASCVALLLFFPIFHQNVLAMRDIWVFYGLVCLLYGILACFYEKISILGLILLCSFFAICQFMRPPSFTIVLSITFILIVIMFLKIFSFKKILKILMCLWGTNILFFWAPFIVYNKIAYNKFFVSPVGQNLLLGLGECENPWGYKLSDSWFDVFMHKTYGEVGGTVECDQKAKELFYESVAEKPLLYFKIVLRRFLYILLPPLPWIGSLWNVVAVHKTLRDKFYSIITSFVSLADFLVHYIYIWFFLLCGYLGLIFLFIKKKIMAIGIVFLGGIVPIWSIVLSHSEPRYLVPTYALFAFFVGYCWVEFFIKLKFLTRKD